MTASQGNTDTKNKLQQFIYMIHKTDLFREFKPVLENFMNVLGEYYGGVIEPDSLIIHFKACMKNTIVYDSELYITSETKDN